MCENQLEKKLAKQLLFVCLSELPSKRSRWERSQRPLYWHFASFCCCASTCQELEQKRTCAAGLRRLPAPLLSRMCGYPNRGPVWLSFTAGTEVLRTSCQASTMDANAAANHAGEIQWPRLRQSPPPRIASSR
jgi:hypothetical protein